MNQVPKQTPMTANGTTRADLRLLQLSNEIEKQKTEKNLHPSIEMNSARYQPTKPK
jgi:hypothetical protein